MNILKLVLVAIEGTVFLPKDVMTQNMTRTFTCSVNAGNTLSLFYR